MSEEEKPTPMNVASATNEGTDFLILKLETEGHSFDYRPGDTISLEVAVENCDERCNYRTFSIASSPTEKGYLMIATRIIRSTFKQTLGRVRVGDPVTVWGPYSSLFTIDENAKGIVMLTRGVGITPLRSFCIYHADRNLAAPATLIYEEAEAGHFLFKNDLKTAEKRSQNLRIIFAGRDREITREVIQQNLPGDVASCLFYVSGPPQYTRELVQLAIQSGAKPGRLRAESFTGY